MNKVDRERIAVLLNTTDDLLNAGVTGSGITNMDVLESVLSDLVKIMRNDDPTATIELYRRDKDFLKNNK